MDRREVLESINRDVKIAYGSLVTPDFLFVERVYRNRPYRVIMEKVTMHAYVYEFTDLNEDVSFVYAIEKQSESYVLNLSMVGPYALFYGVGSNNEALSPITGTSSSQDLVQSYVIDIVSRSGMHFIDQSVLTIPVPINLRNEYSDEFTIYNALFSTSLIEFSPKV